MPVDVPPFVNIMLLELAGSILLDLATEAPGFWTEVIMLGTDELVLLTACADELLGILLDSEELLHTEELLLWLVVEVFVIAA